MKCLPAHLLHIIFGDENELFMLTSDATKIQTLTYNQKQSTLTRCNYKDIGERKEEEGESEHRDGLKRSYCRGGLQPVCVLFRTSFALLVWFPAPGPVKSPHKFIKDENLFSI